MRLTVDPDPDAAIAVLRRAVELGVNHIDTAAFYTSPGGILEGRPGRQRWSTELIKEALHPYPEDLTIATKVGPGVLGGGFEQAKTADRLRAQVEENLTRLGVDRLDLVNLRIIRQPGQDAVAERFGWLAELQAEGLIKNLGLSNVRRDHIVEARRIAPVCCVQNSYSVDHNRDDDDLLWWCADHGIAYVPFFTIAGAAREAGPESGHSDALMAVATSHGVTPTQIRLAWSLQRGPNVLAIPGTGSIAHLEENVAAAAITLEPEELSALG